MDESRFWKSRDRFATSYIFNMLVILPDSSTARMLPISATVPVDAFFVIYERNASLKSIHSRNSSTGSHATVYSKLAQHLQEKTRFCRLHFLLLVYITSMISYLSCVLNLHKHYIERTYPVPQGCDRAIYFLSCAINTLTSDCYILT